MPVIGILGGQSPETYEPFLVPFRQGLSEVGFVEGNNVAIESRWAQGRYDRLPDLADVLVSRRVASQSGAFVASDHFFSISF